MAIVKQINYSDLPEDIQSYIEEFVNPYNRESKLTKDIQTLNTLKKKLGKDVLNIFTTKENLFLDLSNKLEYREIYFLAKIFTSVFKTSVTKNIFFDKKIVFPLDNVKEILLNPTKTLYLTNQFQIKNTDTVNINFNDCVIDFILFFIFACIKSVNISFNLSYNNDNCFYVMDKSFYTIIKGLNQGIKLITLNITSIDTEKAIILAQVLKTNTSLEYIDLTQLQPVQPFVRINEKIGYALAEALQINKTLKVLILNGNKIGDAAAYALAEALKKNTTLKKLELKWNNLSKDLINKIKHNKRISLEYNYAFV
jgi:hypothetical protein